jgi:hypothetical protein
MFLWPTLFSETALTFKCYLSNKSMTARTGNTESHETDCHRGSLSPSRPNAESVPYSRHCFPLHPFQLPGQSTKHPSVDAINSIPSLNQKLSKCNSVRVP